MPGTDDRSAVRFVAASRRHPTPQQPQPAELAELTRLLAAIREARGLSRAQLAARIGAEPAAIVALEAGDLQRLPVWPETRRIVDQWVAGAGLDPRPALSALAAAFEAQGKPADRASPQAVAEALSQASSPVRRGVGGRVDGAAEPGTRRPSPSSRFAARAHAAESPSATAARLPARRPRLRLPKLTPSLPALRLPRPSIARLAFGLPPSRPVRWAALVLILAALGTSATQTRVIAGALSSLPAPAGDALRSISDFIAVQFAPVRSGHRWIEVRDPRTRRADKLRTGPHSD